MTNPVQLLLESPAYVFGRFRPVRTAYAQLQRARQRLSPAPPELRIGEFYAKDSSPVAVRASNVVTTVRDKSAHLHSLSQRSFSEGIQLSADACQQLLAAAKSHPLQANPHGRLEFAELTNSLRVRGRVAIATVVDSARVDAVQAIAGDRFVVDVVASYLGYHPTRVSSWLFWSPKSALTEPEREAVYQTVRFHYDIHYYNFLYVNFYVLDTDERSGAHVLVEGSHRGKRARHLLGSARLSDAEVIREYGADRIRVVAGRAGQGFFEDTICYHKALPPLDRDRLMLQLRYQ